MKRSWKEQEAHLGYEPYQKQGKSKNNSRNGSSKKTLKTSSGEVETEVPRDRNGSFEPQFIQKHQSIDPDLEKRVTSMYARGMSTRDIGQQLQEFYGTEVSPALISKITDKVLKGVPGSNRGCVPAHEGPALRRAPDKELASLPGLEIPQRIFKRPEGSLPRANA